MVADEQPTDAPEWERTWSENASAFDRVKAVTMALSEPQSAPWIAEQAAVSPNTARNHLQRLIDLRVVTVTETTGVRHYYPDQLYTRLRDVRELLDGSTKQQLSEQAAELKDEITTWRETYDADSPDALRTRAADDDVAATEAHKLITVASDWELTRYRLSLVQDALENYDTWTADHPSTMA